MLHRVKSCLLLVTALLLTPILAQDQDLSHLRLSLNKQMTQGHQPISYKRAYQALANLYQDQQDAQKLILFYTQRSQDKQLLAANDGRNGWNREHLWPQSRGARRGPMKSDLHHLKPTDVSVNSHRGSLDFAEGGQAEGEAPGTYLDHDSFEPHADIQGNVARALFYMDVRYEGRRGEPDLMLVRHQGQKPYQLGDLCTLLLWHERDPVDYGEQQRNNYIEHLQGNRNVFVDQPWMARTLYGERCS